MSFQPPNAAATGDAANVGNAPGQQGVVAVLSRDLFFGMRIRASLRPLGYTVLIANDAGAFTNMLSAEAQRPALGLIDFNQPVDWPSLVEAVATSIPIVAFGPHKDVDAFRAARNAGVTRVVANGEFSRTLPDLVERYARAPER